MEAVSLHGFSACCPDLFKLLNCTSYVLKNKHVLQIWKAGRWKGRVKAAELVKHLLVQRNNLLEGALTVDAVHMAMKRLSIRAAKLDHGGEKEIFRRDIFLNNFCCRLGFHLGPKALDL